MMTLQKLGQQYLQQEKLLRQRMRELKAQQLIHATPLLRRRIYYLAQEAAHCGKIGRELTHYYDKEELV
jgi:hypothetical protein